MCRKERTNKLQCTCISTTKHGDKISTTCSNIWENNLHNMKTYMMSETSCFNGLKINTIYVVHDVWNEFMGILYFWHFHKISCCLDNSGAGFTNSCDNHLDIDLASIYSNTNVISPVSPISANNVFELIHPYSYFMTIITDKLLNCLKTTLFAGIHW